MRAFATIFILMIAAGGCKSQQEVVAPTPAPRPEWVKAKPIENDKYAGIGMAYKTQGADYIAIAKNNALNDLASEISVEIKSNSLFYQIEKDDNLREEFQANTKLKSKENLEGYQLEGSFENEQEYWVYYSLNKAEYRILKENRQENAIALAKQFYQNALDFKVQNQYAESIKFNIKAIAAVADYLNEPLQTEWQGKNVFFLPMLYSSLQNTVSSIKISPKNPEVFAKRGQSIGSEKISFFTASEKGKPLAGIPLYIFYSGQRVSNNQLYTNANGTCEFALPKVVSSNEREYVQANLNMVALATEATEDPLIRKLVSKISGAETRTEIIIEKPKIFIDSKELYDGQLNNENLLADAFQRAFVEAGFAITTNESASDFVLAIDANALPAPKQQRFYTSRLSATIAMSDKNGNLLFQQSIQDYHGMQVSQEMAHRDAYKKMAEEIERRYFRDMRRKVFD